jgi:hypothetical protein
MISLKWFAPVPLVLAVACTTVPVQYDYDPKANYSSLKRFDFVAPPRPASTREDHRGEVPEDPIMERRIHRVMEKELTARGFQLEKTAQPDFLVVCYPVWRNHRYYTSQSMGYGWGYRWGWGGSTRVGEIHDVPEGTLVIEVMEPRTREPIWRAVAPSALTGQETPEDAEEQVENAIHKMLDRFPPHASNK